MSDAVGGEFGDVETVDELGVLGDFGGGHVDVDLGALDEGLVVLGAEHHQIAHHQVAGHLDQAAGHEVEVLLVAGGSNLLDGLLIGLGQGGELGGQGCEFTAEAFGGIFLDERSIGAGGDVAYGCHYLQLGRAFVDGGDAGVAVDALAGVVLHEAGTAMDLDAVVGVLVAVFAAHALGHGGQGVGELGVLLHLGALLGSEAALAGDVLVSLVHVDETRGLVEQAAAGVELGLHHGEHLADGGELDDGLAELAALHGVLVSLAVGELADAYALGGDAEAGAVHQGHHVLDEAHAARTAELGGSVLIYQFAGGAALDAHLVLDAAYGHAAVALVVDEHGEAAAVLGAGFGACEHQVDVAVAVGDEALYAVEHPGAVLLLRSLEHYALQIGAGVGFGEVHTHGLALAYAGDVLGALLLAAELIESLGAVLETPEVLEARIGAADDVGGHDIGGDGEVETAEATGHRHAHQACLAAYVEVLDGTVGIESAAVGAGSALVVDALGVGSDGVAANFADDFEYLLIVVHSIPEVLGSIVEFFGFGVVPFLQGHDFLHQGMMQMVAQIGIVCIEVSHCQRIIWSSSCST